MTSAKLLNRSESWFPPKMSCMGVSIITLKMPILKCRWHRDYNVTCSPDSHWDTLPQDDLDPFVTRSLTKGLHNVSDRLYPLRSIGQPKHEFVTLFTADTTLFNFLCQYSRTELVKRRICQICGLFQ